MRSLEAQTPRHPAERDGHDAVTCPCCGVDLVVAFCGDDCANRDLDDSEVEAFAASADEEAAKCLISLGESLSGQNLSENDRRVSHPQRVALNNGVQHQMMGVTL